MKLNRRAVLTAGAAGLFGLAAVPGEACTHGFTAAEFERLAKAPKTPAGYQALAKHLRGLAAEATEEARVYDAVAAVYRRGIAGATQTQAADAARALEHVAGHHRDAAEALEHLIEAYEGLAENFAG